MYDKLRFFARRNHMACGFFEISILFEMRHANHIRFDARYPTTEDLRGKARKRIPAFAFDYLDGGCNQGENLRRNRTDLGRVVLMPRYIREYDGCRLETRIFGRSYSAPFGIAPIGLQGMIWPGAPEILASAAHRQGLPFILSTVGTASIERISQITEGEAWFQFYYPAEAKVRDELINRAWDAGCRTLVLLCDTPTFGFRPGEFRNGLSMPPRLVYRNLIQMIGRPSWTLGTLKKGAPQFANLKPYMPARLNLTQLGRFMDGFFDKPMTPDKIARIRDQWKGNLILKGVSTLEDAAYAVKLGVDGLVVSNHGGRQLDVGPSSISVLQGIASAFGEKTQVMMDSGLRSGPDIARALACGARMTLLGRAFMYGVGALGPKGADHTIEMLRSQLQQVMEQLGCSTVEMLPDHLRQSSKDAEGK